MVRATRSRRCSRARCVRSRAAAARAGEWVRDPVQRRLSPPTAVGSRRAPDDVVDPNQPLLTLDIEEYAIVADPLTELGRMVLKGRTSP
jgi:hypothetical protein